MIKTSKIAKKKKQIKFNLIDLLTSPSHKSGTKTTTKESWLLSYKDIASVIVILSLRQSHTTSTQVQFKTMRCRVSILIFVETRE